MQNISGYGILASIIASKTFPVALVFDQFADDIDPLDIPSNGDLVSWSKPTPIRATVAVVPGSNSDINLAVLLEANRVGRGKVGARDIITFTAVYPAGNFITLQNGAIISGTPASSVASSARFKSKTYAFAFENRIGA